MRPDADLVRAVLAGQREVFADLVRRYEVAVRAAVRAVVHDENEAQDVVQETFVAAYVKLRMLKQPQAFGAWLLQIARRRALSAVQRQRETRSLEGVNPATGLSQNGELDEASQRLLAAIARLPERERILVQLKYFSRQPISAIAQITGRPIGTITVQLSRARARLRRLLEEVR